MKYLDAIYFGNSGKEWLIALGAAAVIFILVSLAKSIAAARLRKLAERYSNDIMGLIADLVGKTGFFFRIALALYIGLYFISLPAKTMKAAEFIIILVFVWQVIWWGNGLISFWVNRYKQRKKAEDPTSATTVAALGVLIKIAFWAIVILVGLDNMGVNVTGLVAGLGIGGIAVALAAQNILGDLFASLSIIFDRPFVIGDFIILDSMMGTVENIGLKTTHVRSLSGELLVIPNSDLMKSRIRNYKRMYKRRIVFSFGVIYQTPYDKLNRIPSMVREIIDNQDHAIFDRSHFKEYGNSSLNFETVYNVDNPDYNLYMDVQQAINLKIYQRFEQEGIEFAYPTQTIYITNEE